jgi:DNA polymerase/3'-5' exonuclease PolX
MKNQLIIDEFEKLIEQIKYDIDINNDNKNIFRLKQITNSLKLIKKYPHTILKGEDLQDYVGIGKGTIKRINEILDTNKLSEITLTQKNLNKNDIIAELESVINIGHAKSLELFNKGITSIKDLKDKHKKGLIKLNDKILLGLKYHGKYEQKIPRYEITIIDKYFQKIIKQISENLHGKICGSYRRKKDNSSDIDLLLVHSNIHTKKQLNNTYLMKFIKKLKDENIILDDLTDKNVNTKYMGFIKYKKSPIIRLDIRFVAFESWYPALLYFTGSGDLNIIMRQKAIENKYKLNEYGLFKNDKMIKVTSENDIFKLLNMPYLEPQQR